MIEIMIKGFLFGICLLGGISFGILVIPIKKSKTQEIQEEFNKKIEGFWELRTNYEKKMVVIIEKLVDYQLKKDTK